MSKIQRPGQCAAVISIGRESKRDCRTMLSSYMLASSITTCWRVSDVVDVMLAMSVAGPSCFPGQLFGKRTRCPTLTQHWAVRQGKVLADGEELVSRPIGELALQHVA